MSDARAGDSRTQTSLSLMLLFFIAHRQLNGDWLLLAIGLYWAVMAIRRAWTPTVLPRCSCKRQR